MGLLCILGLGCSTNTSEPEPREPRAKVTLGTILEGEQGKAISLPDGTQIELTAWYVVLSDMEIHTCEEQKEEKSNLAPFSLIKTAHAHVPSSATRLGTPFVLDLLAEPKRAKIIGEIAPPRGEYCTMYVIIAPADDDVMNVTERASEDFEGKSMILEGRYRTSDSAAWKEFKTASDARFAQKISLEGAKKITLDMKKNSAFVLLSTPMPHTKVSAKNMQELPTALLQGMARTWTRYQPNKKSTP